MPSQRLGNDRVCVQYQEIPSSPGVCSSFRFFWNAQNLIRSSTFGTQMVDIYVGPLWQHCLVHERFFWSALDRGEPSKTPELAVKTLALEEECLTLPKKAYKTTGIPEEHRKCVVADKGDRQMTTEGYELFKRWLRASGDPGKSPLPFRVVGNAVLARYFTSYLTACDGRRFFSAVEGGISLGPLGITPGDDVCVLLNGPIPFIFRQKEAKDNFEHVGHAYVYGIMYGEALEKHSNEE